MSRSNPRQFASALFVAVAVLALSACGQDSYPNSTFTHLTDLNTSIDALWNRLLFFGTIVFMTGSGWPAPSVGMITPGFIQREFLIQSDRCFVSFG